jgi:membrane protein DedA with SNARE-associated domain
MFSFALLGGLTTFNTVPYYSLLFLLATTGIDPLYLGLSSAFGVMCGDSFSYLLGRQGGTVIPERFQNFFGKVKNLAEKHEKVFLFFCFLYGSISPLSNDFISLSAGMARIKYWKVMLPLGLGNIVFNVSFAYLCVYGGGWVGKIIS